MTTACFLISVKEGVEDGAGARSKGRLWTLRSKGAALGDLGVTLRSLEEQAGMRWGRRGEGPSLSALRPGKSLT